MSFYSDFRAAVATGLKKGWIKYPGHMGDEIIPMPDLVFRRPKDEPQKAHRCRKCFWIWTDGGKSCPKCMCEQFTLA